MKRTGLTVAELARIAEGELFGSQDVIINGVAELDKAVEHDITYAVDATYVKKLAASAASAAVVPRGTVASVNLDIPLIEVDVPYWSFARILGHFAPVTPTPDPLISPHAFVSPEAETAAGVIIGPGVVIEADAHIGPRCRLDPGVKIGYGCRIGADCHLHPGVIIRNFCILGDRVIIHSGSVIGTDGYGFVEKDGSYHKIPQIGIVEIENDVEIGSLVCIDRATIGRTLIGAGSKLDNLIQIGHNVELGKNCALVAQVGISGSTIVGDNCRFAGQSATSGHLTIGAGSTIAARGVVTRSIPAKSFVSGFPARPHKEERKIKASLPRLPGIIRRVNRIEQHLAKLSENSGED